MVCVCEFKNPPQKKTIWFFLKAEAFIIIFAVLIKMSCQVTNVGPQKNKVQQLFIPNTLN